MKHLLLRTGCLSQVKKMQYLSLSPTTQMPKKDIPGTYT